MIKSNKKFYIVDAFTDKPFTGNPAAVFILNEEIPDSLKQKIASEINLSETAFLLKNKGRFNLRWFTPCMEVDLCGHATMAAAHIIWEAGLLSQDKEVRFDTRSGELTARISNGLIKMIFPADFVNEIELPSEYSHSIKDIPIFKGKGKFDYLAEYEDESIIKKFIPDYEKIKELDSRGLIITSRSADKDYDFVSRFFAPNAGINEDPVTGSAHCTLATYWSEKLGKKSLTGYQASERGGILNTDLLGDTVILSGKAVTVIKSELLI